MKTNTDPWFLPAGWVYRPANWKGIAVLLAAAAFCTQVFVAVDRHSHSVSDTLYGVFPYVVPTFLLVIWIAGRTSGNRH